MLPEVLHALQHHGHAEAGAPEGRVDPGLQLCAPRGDRVVEVLARLPLHDNVREGPLPLAGLAAEGVVDARQAQLRSLGEQLPQRLADHGLLRGVHQHGPDAGLCLGLGFAHGILCVLLHALLPDAPPAGSLAGGNVSLAGGNVRLAGAGIQLAAGEVHLAGAKLSLRGQEGRAHRLVFGELLLGLQLGPCLEVPATAAGALGHVARERARRAGLAPDALALLGVARCLDPPGRREGVLEAPHSGDPADSAQPAAGAPSVVPLASPPHGPLQLHQGLPAEAPRRAQLHELHLLERPAGQVETNHDRPAAGEGLAWPQLPLRLRRDED
mmetsp:Transcript_94661/g.276762  ORF Transcript_94661/g.276762 Transcript_94661/m.276762 type:complete len:327 (-) Transcript_94661:904-1884(-)